MGARQTFVIVGANLAGGAAARTLREEGFDGRLVMIGEEPDPPYERPPLSKEFLRGEAPFERSLLLPVEWYAQNDVDLRLGRRAVALELQRRQVEVEGPELVGFDRLLIATGGRNRRLPVPGADLPGVHELRTRHHAEAIREDAAVATRMVVVGAGFIGMEVAASLRSQDLEVDVVEFLDAPLVRVLGPEVGNVFRGFHEDRGVRFHFGQGVDRFEGSERFERVVTSTGRVVEGDLAVVGVGIQPNDELAREAGIAVDNGVLVDEWCRTSAEGVFAAGDVANHQHPLFGRLRVEHWDNALKQGAAAARSMLGTGGAFDDPHWFWTDQFEHNFQYMGSAREWDDLVIRGKMEERSFVAFYLKDGVVDAVAGLNRGREVRRSAGLIRSRRPVDPKALRDEDVDLKKLAAPVAASSEGDHA